MIGDESGVAQFSIVSNESYLSYLHLSAKTDKSRQFLQQGAICNRFGHSV